jgi:hypothetical protein
MPSRSGQEKLYIFLFTLLIFNKQPGKFPSRVKTVLDVGGHFHPKAVFGGQTNILPVH